MRPPDNRVIWVRDKESKTPWHIPRKLVITVGTLRLACGLNPRYRDHRDKSLGFIQLFFKSKILADDSVLIDDIDYPDQTAESTFRVQYVEVDVNPVATFEISCNFISIQIACHAAVTVARLKSRLAGRFGVPGRDLRFDDHKFAIEDTTMVHSLPTRHLRVRLDRYCCLSIAGKDFTEARVFPATGTVLELIAALQMQLIERRHAKAMCDLVLSKNGVVLDANVKIGDVFPEGMGNVSLGYGPAWPLDQMTVSFRLPAGPVYSLALPSSAPMALVKRMIADIPGVHISDVFFEYDVDWQQRLCDFLAEHPDVVRVRTSTFELLLRSTGPSRAEWRLPNVFMSDRIFDIKQTFCASLSSIATSPSNLVFLVGGLELRDYFYVSRFIFNGPVVIGVRMLRVDFCHLTFSDYEGRSTGVYVNLSRIPPPTLKECASSLTSDFLTLGFECDGQEFKPTTRVAERLWDPHVPIYLTMRSPTVAVCFAEFSNRDFVCNINSRTTGRIIHDEILQLHPDFTHLDLFCAGSLLSPKTRVLEINPDLIHPIIVRNVTLAVSPELPVLHYVASTGPGACPLESARPKLADTRPLLSGILNVQPDKMEISLANRTVRDDDVLDPSRIYTIFMTDQRMVLKLQFLPIGETESRLIGQTWVDFAKQKTFDDLARLLLSSRKLPLGLQLSFSIHGEPVRMQDSLMALRSGIVPAVHYRTAAPPVDQRFAHADGSCDCLTIAADDDVRSVKRRLLSSRPKSPLGSISIHFFEFQLADNDNFASYGIPANSTLEVREVAIAPRPVIVHFPDGDRSFDFAITDTVGDLMRVLTFPRPFALFGTKGLMTNEQLLSDLDPPKLEVAEVFRFEAPNKTFELPLRADATVADARAALAAHVGLPESVVSLRTTENPEDLIWELGRSVKVARLARRQVFIYDGRQDEFDVEVDLPMAKVAEMAGGHFGIFPVKLFLEGLEMDASKSLADLSLNEKPITVVSPQPAPLPVTIFLGPVPHRASFALPRNATIAQVEAALRERFGIEHGPLEFGLCEGGRTDSVCATDALDNLDLSEKVLVARHVQRDGAPRSRKTVRISAVDGADSRESLLDTLRVVSGAVVEAPKVWQFFCEQRAEKFQLRLGTGSRVGEAKEAVARRYRTNKETVELQFVGVRLQDTMLMGRLRLGSLGIQVILHHPS
jgi:hypothetical protein